MKGKSEVQSSKASQTDKTDTSEAGDISIEPSRQSVLVDKSVSFKALLNGKDITTSVSWSSLDQKIAQSEGSGEFTGVDLGKTKIKARLEDGREAQADIQVERPEEFKEGKKYSKLVYGIENCKENIADSNNRHGDCLGDCDDAWLVIEGDLTLVTYNKRVFLISNKKQTVTITTYTGSWNWNENAGRIDHNTSKLYISVRDKYDQEIASKSKSLLLHQGNLQSCPFSHPVESTSVAVSKGDAIDIESRFKGTAIDDGECPAKSKLTRATKEAQRYFLRELLCTNPAADTSRYPYNNCGSPRPRYWCCPDESEYCSQRID